MPLPAKRLDRGRVDFSSHITEKEVEQLVSHPDIRTLQCSSPVEPDTWDLLNRKLFSQRPEIELRVWGLRRGARHVACHHRNVQAGLEAAILRLTDERSTTELPGNTLIL